VIQRIEEMDPEFARECGDAALRAVVRAGDMELAKRLMPSPLKRWIEGQARHLQLGLEWLREPSNPRRVGAHVEVYVDGVRRVVAILRATGERSRADHVLELAISLAEKSSAGALVRAELAEGL
jgi:hypothetical protein